MKTIRSNVFETTNEKSDTEFHKFLEAKGYSRIQAGSRIERFEISVENAKPKEKFERVSDMDNLLVIEEDIASYRVV